MKRDILYKALNQIYEPFASVEKESRSDINSHLYLWLGIKIKDKLLQ